MFKGAFLFTVGSFLVAFITLALMEAEKNYRADIQRLYKTTKIFIIVVNTVWIIRTATATLVHLAPPPPILLQAVQVQERENRQLIPGSGELLFASPFYSNQLMLNINAYVYFVFLDLSTTFFK